MPSDPFDVGTRARRERHAAREALVRRRRRGAAAAVVVAAAVAAGVWAGGGGHGGRRGPAGAAGGAAAGVPSGSATTGGHGGPDASDRWLAAYHRLLATGLPVYCGGRHGDEVALTFDDGPGPYTTLALRRLRAHHLRATFFLVGRSIGFYPTLAPRERELAAFGDHTLTHPFLPALAAAAVAHELGGAKRLIEQVSGAEVRLFRPPYGARTRAIDSEARALGMVEIVWNVDSRDSEGANYAGIAANVSAGLRPGAIVLMHENRGQTIRALPAIIAALDRKRLRAVTLPRLLSDDPPSLSQLRAGGRGCGAVVRRTSG